jgi:hypothetical protein
MGVNLLSKVFVVILASRLTAWGVLAYRVELGEGVVGDDW